ncbi:MAG: hypothetical protein IPM90_15905 [Austwickia sp.]|jgi:hypothetical protein|nr:hypothetical protein [Austwickia sp.]MBK9102917.1 hypothetical protein [Austwickia sp.]
MRGPSRPRRAVLSSQVIALAVLANLAVLLWCVAIPQTWRTISHAGADAVTATVVWCPPEIVRSEPCRARFTHHGQDQVRPLGRPGLFGVEPGDVVHVAHVAQDPATELTMTGWRAVLDSALLLSLALLVTRYGLRRWRRWRPAVDHAQRHTAGDASAAGPQVPASPASPPFSHTRAPQARGRRSHPAA